MKALQRYLATLKGEATDFIGRVPILMQFAAEYIGSNYGAFASDHRVLVEANVRCAEDFGIDQLSAISDPYRETQGFGAEILFVKDGVPQCPHPPLEVSKSLESLSRPDPLRSERMVDRVNAIRAYSEGCRGQYSIMGWVEGPAAEAADLRGVTSFLMDMMDDEPFAEELMDLCVDVGIAFAKAQLEAGADTIGIGDAIASQVSPRVYEKLIQPREKRLIEAIKKMGGIVRLHICGDTTHLLEGISDLPIDIMDVDHEVSMKQVRETLGSKVVLTGNIDPAGGVRFGTPESIRATIEAIYEQVGNPYMVNAGCEIPPGTPPENLRALCAELRYR